jgi:hypothetical protein
LCYEQAIDQKSNTNEPNLSTNQWALCYQIAQNSSQTIQHAPCQKTAFVMLMLQINLIIQPLDLQEETTSNATPPLSKNLTENDNQTRTTSSSRTSEPNTTNTPAEPKKITVTTIISNKNVTSQSNNEISLPYLLKMEMIDGIARTLLKQAKLSVSQTTCTFHLAKNLKPMLTEHVKSLFLKAIKQCNADITVNYDFIQATSAENSHLSTLKETFSKTTDDVKL